jgi:hypothetical protein
MFRPNIRGYNRSKIGFTLRGWIFAGEIKTLFLHRWPWRKNWLHELNTNQDLEVSFSRSGAAHLHRIRKLELTKGGFGFSRFYKIAAGSIISLCLAIPLYLWQLSSNPNYSDEDTVTSQSAIQRETEPQALVGAKPTKSVCPKSEDSYPVLEKWVLGERDPLVQITKFVQFEIGGVRSSHVELRCGESVFEFELLEALTAEGWRLRKSTQLEN